MLVFTACATQVNIEAPADELPRGAIEPLLLRLRQHDLAGLQEPDQLFANADGHRGIGETRKAFHGLRLIGWIVADLLLHLETSGAAAVRLRHERAERVFVFFPVQRHLPVLDWPERERETGGGVERALVVLIKRGAGELLN